MIRSILVPLDGTAYGEHALPLACELAQRLGATLHLVHVHSDVALATAMESLALLGGGVQPGTTNADEQAYLDGLADRLRADGIRAETQVLVGGRADALEDYARRRVDLVVASTHAHEGLTRVWHRALGERIVHDLGIPAILWRVRPEGEKVEEAPAFRHILVPLNRTPESEDALLSVAPIAQACRATLTLLHVIRPVEVIGYTLLAQDAHVNDFVLDEQKRDAEAYLSTVAERLRAIGLRVDTRVEAAREPAHAIENFVRSPDEEVPPVDLVALATHCHSPVRRAVAISVSDSLLHSLELPVLLHRCRSDVESAEQESATDLTRSDA
jgi:nucleotide-binding universal stress UspA family protein